jgi:hypothetical protein
LEFFLRVAQPFFAAADLDNAFFFVVVRFAVVFLVVFLIVFFVVAIFKKENNIVFDYGMTKNIGNENKRNVSYMIYTEHTEMNLKAV